jgi:hypothetical protein
VGDGIGAHQLVDTAEVNVHVQWRVDLCTRYLPLPDEEIPTGVVEPSNPDQRF